MGLLKFILLPAKRLPSNFGFSILDSVPERNRRVRLRYLKYLHLPSKRPENHFSTCYCGTAHVPDSHTRGAASLYPGLQIYCHYVAGFEQTQVSGLKFEFVASSQSSPRQVSQSFLHSVGFPVSHFWTPFPVLRSPCSLPSAPRTLHFHISTLISIFTHDIQFS